jgi:protocatechuate 3,4-dioxygenase beta subunit
MKSKVAVSVLIIGLAGVVFFTLRAATTTGSASPRSAEARHPETADSQPALNPGGQGHSERAADATGPEQTPRKVKEGGQNAVEASDAPLPAGFVAGRVRLADGRLPLGVKVRLVGLDRPDDPAARAPRRETDTVADGEFRFDGLPPGRYWLSATHPEFAPSAFVLELTKTEGSGPHVVLLKSGGAIRVCVRGAGDAPAKGERIAVSEMTSTSSRTVYKGVTDDHGELRVEHLSPGQYEVRRIDASGLGAARGVAVLPEKTVEVRFDVSCGLVGVVTSPQGQPLADAIVRLMPASMEKGGFRSTMSRTDQQGRYEIAGYPPGEYVMDVHTGGSRRYGVCVGRVTLRAGETVEYPVHIRPTYLSGRITSAETGMPVKVIGIWKIQAKRVELHDGEVVRTEHYGAKAFPGEDGRYMFVGLSPGFYRIRVPAPLPELCASARVVDFTAGQELGDVDFALKSREVGHLRLRVREPDGSPASGLVFRLRTGPGRGKRLRVKEIGPGEFAVVLGVGEREVLVYREGLYPGLVKVIIERGKTVEREIELRAD